MCAIIEIVKEILKNMLQFVFLLSLLEEDFIYIYIYIIFPGTSGQWILKDI